MTGEARRRGTPEERKSLAIARQALERAEREQYLKDHPPPPVSLGSASLLALAAVLAPEPYLPSELNRVTPRR